MENQQTGENGRLMTVFELIGSSWRFYAQNFKSLIGLYFVAIVGGMLTVFASELFLIMLLGVISIPAFQDHRILFGAAGGIILATLLFFTAWSGVALMKSVTDIYGGAFQGIKSAYRRSISLLWPFIVIVVAFMMILVGGEYLLIIPYIIFLVYLKFCVQEFFFEGKRGFDALLGSWDLVRGRWWKVFGTFLLLSLLFFLGTVAAILVSAIAGIIFSLFSFPGILGFILIAIFGIILVVGLFLVMYPLLLIIQFEFYRSLKKTQTPPVASNDKLRKGILIALIAIGILLPVAIQIWHPFDFVKDFVASREERYFTQLYGGLRNSEGDSGSFLPNSVYENSRYGFRLTYPEGSYFSSANPDLGFITRFFLPDGHAIDGDEENIGIYVNKTSHSLEDIIQYVKDASSKYGPMDIKKVEFGGQEGYRLIYNSEYTAPKGTKELFYVTVKDGVDYQLNYFPVVDSNLPIADAVARSFEFIEGLPTIDSIYPAIAEVGSSVAIAGSNFAPTGTSSSTDITAVRITNGSYSAMLWSGIPVSAGGKSKINAMLPANIIPGPYKVVVDVGGRGSSNEADLSVEKY